MGSLGTVELADFGKGRLGTIELAYLANDGLVQLSSLIFQRLGLVP